MGKRRKPGWKPAGINKTKPFWSEVSSALKRPYQWFYMFSLFSKNLNHPPKHMFFRIIFLPSKQHELKYGESKVDFKNQLIWARSSITVNIKLVLFYVKVFAFSDTRMVCSGAFKCVWEMPASETQGVHSIYLAATNSTSITHIIPACLSSRFTVLPAVHSHITITVLQQQDVFTTASEKLNVHCEGLPVSNEFWFI